MVVAPDAFASTPTLTGERVRLVPLGPQHAATLHRLTGDPETNRLTGTHRTFTRAEIDAWCASRAEQTDRLDLAIESTATGVGLHRVQLEVYEFNERARRSYERCGFEVEGRLRDALHWGGAWHDTLVMAVVRS